MSLNELTLIFFYVIILLYSVILHEVSHGVMALWLGDQTAKYAGRLTANPFKHIDLWLTIIMPIFLLLISGGRFAFGGAKPVPYNPYNLKNQKWGPALVALAGPLSNIILALVFALIAHTIFLPLALKNNIMDAFYYTQNWAGLAEAMAGSIQVILYVLCVMVIYWNVLLAFFNLIPFPPLDGSKILFAVFPIKIETLAILEQFGFIALFAFIILFSNQLNLFFTLMFNLFRYIAT